MPVKKVDVIVNQCGVCDKTFPSIHGLKLHTARIHKQKDLLTCNICNKIFAKEQVLYKHKDTYDQEFVLPLSKKRKHCDSNSSKDIIDNDITKSVSLEEAMEVDIKSHREIEVKVNEEELEEMEIETDTEKEEMFKVASEQPNPSGSRHSLLFLFCLNN